MTKSFLLSISILVLVTGCKTLSVNQTLYKTTVDHLTLGGVSLSNKSIVTPTSTNVAIPAYKTPVKTQATTIPFTAKTYKAYAKAAKIQIRLDSITSDSLNYTPKFIQLHIADKVALLEALNDDSNSNLKTYLSYNPKSGIVTDISIKFPLKQLQLIQNADAIFLTELHLKTYALQLYKDGVKTEKIPLSDGTVFAYKVANACWKENRQRKLQIIDLVSTCNCPKATYKVSQKAKTTYKLF